MKKILILVTLAGVSLSLSGCLAAAAGAAVGYGAHKAGYRLQNPLTKD